MNFHQFIQDGPGWKTLGCDCQYSDPHAKVWKVQVQTPTRQKPVHWTVVHRKGASVVAPMTAEGKLVLVRQERVPIRQTIWEFPAGQIEENSLHSQAAIESAALRELTEESGYELGEGGKLISLGHFFPSSGFTDEHCHLFLATPVVPSPSGQKLDANEMITEFREFSVEEFRAMIASSEIKDANTLSAFARMCAMGLL